MLSRRKFCKLVVVGVGLFAGLKPTMHTYLGRGSPRIFDNFSMVIDLVKIE